MPEPYGFAQAVLIADDDSLVRLVLRMSIESLGHEVVDVPSSDGLASNLAGRTFSLCIMDASIPGTTLERRLGLLDSLAPEMPVIIMSGYTEQPEAVRQRRLRFLGKPISLDALTAALAEVGLTSRAEIGSA